MSKAFKLLSTTGHYGRNCYQALHVPKGMCVEVRAFAMDPIIPMQVFPAGRAVSAEGGVAVHRGDAK